MCFLEYEKEKKEVIAKFIDKMGISEDELILLTIVLGTYALSTLNEVLDSILLNKSVFFRPRKKTNDCIVIIDRTIVIRNNMLELNQKLCYNTTLKPR